jgi:hypothetical protein
MSIWRRICREGIQNAENASEDSSCSTLEEPPDTGDILCEHDGAMAPEGV